MCIDFTEKREMDFHPHFTSTRIGFVLDNPQFSNYRETYCTHFLCVFSFALRQNLYVTRTQTQRLKESAQNVHSINFIALNFFVTAFPKTYSTSKNGFVFSTSKCGFWTTNKIRYSVRNIKITFFFDLLTFFCFVFTKFNCIVLYQLRWWSNVKLLAKYRIAIN